jgi:hypothetical protein
MHCKFGYPAETVGWNRRPEAMNGRSKNFLKEFSKKGLLHIFKIGQKFGVNILPNHYYVPIADLQHLSEKKKFWARPSSLAGIDIDEESQLKFLHENILPFQKEYIGSNNYRKAVEGQFGPGFGFIESQALHGFVRATKPRRIIEIGSGVSTYCMLKALEANYSETKERFDVTCIEPNPRRFLRQNTSIKLIESPLEEVDFSIFDNLSSGDFLFVDSSHAIRTGGDVLSIYLEIIPRLRSGVNIHIHDITLPYNYNRDVLNSMFQWHETAMLQSLLVNNRMIKILFCMSYLHYRTPDGLKRVFPEYEPQENEEGLCVGDSLMQMRNGRYFPSSTYLRTQEE